MATSTTQLMDFSLGFAEVDRAWADWITWVLEAEGYTIEAIDLEQLEREEVRSFHLLLVVSDNFQADSRYESLVRRFLDRQTSEESRVFPIILTGYNSSKATPPVYPIRLTNCDRPEAQNLLLDEARTSPLPFQPPPQPPFRKSQPPFPRESEQQGWIQTREHRSAQGYVEKLGDALQLEMMQIPGGMFTMGAPKSEEDSQNSERPTHRVTVQQFFMGRYPVTQAQWRFIAGLEAVNRELDVDPSNFKGNDHPVEEVSWLDAIEFCDRLSRYTGREYCLPTEAQWEYACRGKTTTPFHFGETINPDIANYDGNYVYGQGQKGFYREQTTPVGSFKIANAFGLYDMHGNVWEWCMDHWHEDYEKAPTDGSAWLDEKASEDDRRVLRGGSWNLNPRDCRSASRFRYFAVDRLNFIGFRILSPARTLS